MKKYHPRIHPLNYPVLSRLGPGHPATRALQVHAESRDECVGKEIAWGNLGIQAIDQEWFSQTDQRMWRFSAFAYAFLSFDLVLGGWLAEDQTKLQPFEADFLHELPRLLRLLTECRSAADADGNTNILPLVSKAVEFFIAFETSILFRLGEVSPQLDNRRIDSLWGAGKSKS